MGHHVSRHHFDVVINSFLAAKLKTYRSLTFKKPVVTTLPTIFEEEDASEYVFLNDVDQSDSESVGSLESWEDFTAEQTEDYNTASPSENEDFMSFLNNLGSTMM